MAAPQIIHFGTRIIYGCEAKYMGLPISNLPADAVKVRTRWRNDRAAAAFVKTPTAVSKWILQTDGDRAIKLGILQGVNTRQPLTFGGF